MRFFIALAASIVLGFTAAPLAAQAQTAAFAEPSQTPELAAVVRPVNHPITELDADHSTSDGTPADTTLRPLSAQQRYELGQQQARKAYKPSALLFLAGMGSGYTVSCGAGVAGAAVLLTAQPSPKRILATAPNPQLLADDDYNKGYQNVVRRKRNGLLLAGVGTGVVAASATLIAIFSSSLGGL